MKTFKLPVCLLLCLISATAFSQKINTARPVLFSSFPDEMQISKSILQNTFNVKEGQQVTVAFSDKFHFSGTVLSNQKKYDNLRAVMIKSPMYGNAIFQLSRIINEDNSVSYAGRIINPDAFDGYEIKRGMNDNYTFKKFQTKKILEDCSY